MFYDLIETVLGESMRCVITILTRPSRPGGQLDRTGRPQPPPVRRAGGET
jgi:hypothetical protein